MHVLRGEHIHAFFYHGILQRNHRKMTIHDHFPMIPL